jgi:hypothetical protein
LKYEKLTDADHSENDNNTLPGELRVGLQSYQLLSWLADNTNVTKIHANKKFCINFHLENLHNIQIIQAFRFVKAFIISVSSFINSDHCGHDRMVVRSTTICIISAYHHLSCEFEPRLWQGILNTLCDKVCQWLAAGQRFSPGTPVSSTNKTDRHNITEILMKVALNTINQPNNLSLINTVFTNLDIWGEAWNLNMMSNPLAPSSSSLFSFKNLFSVGISSNVRSLSGLTPLGVSVSWNIHREWMNDCCLTPTQQIFQLYYGESKLIFSMRWWWGLLCARPKCLVVIL